MARTCDEGGCTLPAAHIGTYEDNLKQKRTAAACTHAHQATLAQRLAREGYEAQWRLFPEPPSPKPLNA